jgi:hypothetical protein
MESDHQLVLQNGRAAMTEASAQNYFFENQYSGGTCRSNYK